MAKYVRITARPTVDNPDEFPLYVDLILDDNDKVLGNYPIFWFSRRDWTEIGCFDAVHSTLRRTNGFWRKVCFS